ncbi:MAG: SurA N-terminal domain-containing protein [Alphaproteobacteria bacterium]|nr:SurA N-terminal domain-containing protein [Alphaproteobacteria bacterium]
MLEFMRKFATTWFIKVFLAILIFSFAAWGIGDVFRTRASDTAAVSVAGTRISMAVFQQEFAREVDRISNLTGQRVTQDQARAMGVDRMVLARLARGALFDAAANDLGLLVSDAQVLQDMVQTPEFKNKAGEFDRAIFMDTLNRNGYSEDRYVASVRRDIAREQVLSPIATGAAAPKGLVERMYAHTAESRTVSGVRISHDAITGVPAPSRADLEAFHKDRSADFMSPETRDVTAAVLRAEDLAAGVSVSDAELQAAYAEREAEFVTHEKRKLLQILVPDEAAAKKARTLVDGGAEFVDMITEVGANPAMFDIGLFTRDAAESLSPEIAQAVFAAPKGGYVGPLQSPLGWHVLQVDDIEPGNVRPLDDVRVQLTHTIKLDRALTQLFEQSNRLDDLLGGGMTIEEAAGELGVAPTILKGVRADGTPSTAPYAAELAKAAFTMAQGQPSLMTETEDGKAFFVARVDTVTLPALRPLDDVIQAVTDAWSRAKRAETAAELAKTVQARLDAGEPAAAVAQSIGQQAIQTQPFTRDAKGLEQNALPASMLKTIFTLQPGQTASAEGTGAHVVVRLAQVLEATATPAAPGYTAVEQKTLGDLRADLLDQMTAALEAAHGLSINPSALTQDGDDVQ